ncbi:MAG: GGDEF domain-containing response regulator [Gemmatimonadetes bacterium]|nr:GGDEF domain-containing response regulator [Gemmatimonadota bacterium]
MCNGESAAGIPGMEGEALKILLAEDDAEDARQLEEALEEDVARPFLLVRARNLLEALSRLRKKSFDVILLDLTLPNGDGVDMISRVQGEAPDVPVVVLTRLEDEQTAIRALKGGAQDYLVKGKVNGELLFRSSRYAIERHRLLAELRALSLVDELTAVYNRRGFLTLVQQQLKVAHRQKRTMLLFFADLDGVKRINDTFGHAEGDRALVDAAELLKQTFRESDIVARLGGDEFAVFAIESTPDSAQIMMNRLERNLAAHNAEPVRPYPMSISMGIAVYDPASPTSVDDLLSRADRLMYEHKRSKKAQRQGGRRRRGRMSR